MDGLPTGRRQAEDARGFPTKKSALDHALLAEALAKPPRAAEHPWQRRGKETVAGYAPGWVESQILEETSRETYQRTADRIVGHLGAMAREDVTPDDVRKMLKALKKSGLRDATIAVTLDLARGSSASRHAPTSGTGSGTAAR